MNLIAAVDLDWGIGYEGDLLEKIPADMKYFKEKTLGKVVVMGRKTFESLPNKQPLKDRKNIILTTNEDFSISNGICNMGNITVCHSIEALMDNLSNFNCHDIFVIGGESIYSQLLPYCNVAYITKIYKRHIYDKSLIQLEKDCQWEKIISGEKQTYNNDICYSFDIYKRKT